MLDDVQGRSHTAPVDNCLGGSDTASVTSKNPPGPSARRRASNQLYQPFVQSVSDDESSTHGSVHTTATTTAQLLEPPSSSSIQPDPECLKDSVKRIRRLVQQSPRKNSHSTTSRRGETFPPPKPATASGSSGYVSKFSSHRRPASSLDFAFAHHTQPVRLRSEEAEEQRPSPPPPPPLVVVDAAGPRASSSQTQAQAQAQASSAPHTPPSANNTQGIRRGWESKLRHLETHSRLEPPASVHSHSHSHSVSPNSNSNSNLNLTPPPQLLQPPLPTHPPIYRPAPQPQHQHQPQHQQDQHQPLRATPSSHDFTQERVRSVTMTIAREAAREASRGAGSDALSRDSSSALPSKSELIERMIAYSRSNQRPRGDNTSQSIHSNLSQPRSQPQPQPQHDINMLAPSPIINDAPAVAPPRRRLSSNINGAKAAAMRQAFSRTAPIARSLNNNNNNNNHNNHHNNNGINNDQTTNSGATFETTDTTGGDAKSSSSQHYAQLPPRAHTSVLKTNSHQYTSRRPHDSLYNTPGDSHSTSVSTQPPLPHSKEPNLTDFSSQKNRPGTAVAAATTTLLAVTPDRSTGSSTSSDTNQKSKEPWKELQWRQFSIAMRDSLAHQNLNFNCAVSLLTEMRARLPADLKDMTLDEVVRRLVVWVNRTESLQKQ